jgi:hypothetical protein
MSPSHAEETTRLLVADVLKTDTEVQDTLAEVLEPRFADRDRTEDRFERLLNELRELRLESNRKWEEQKAEDAARWAENNRKWEEQRAEDARRWEEHKAEDAERWAENNRKWEEQRAEDARRWEEHQREDAARWEENRRRWAESDRRFDEQMREIRELGRRIDEQHKRLVEHDRRFDEQQKRLVEHGRRFDAMLAEFRKLKSSHDQSIGALGARWGLTSEAAFREALKSILEESFNVRVINWRRKDAEGVVRGYPSEIELDVIIHNGTLIIIELKSSMSQADLDKFVRAAAFYEAVNDVKANRPIVVSPMVSAGAVARAKETGVEIFGYIEDIDPRVLQG